MDDIFYGVSPTRSIYSLMACLEFDWRFCKHPLPETVYDVYMNSWRGVKLAQ
jgi:hypothetical protein